MSLAAAAIEANVPEEGNCDLVAMALCVCFGGYFLALITLRPYYAPWDLIAQTFSAFLLFAGTVLVTIGAMASPPKAAFMQAGGLVIAGQMFFILGVGIVGLIVYVLEATGIIGGTLVDPVTGKMWQGGDAADQKAKRLAAVPLESRSAPESAQALLPRHAAGMSPVAPVAASPLNSGPLLTGPPPVPAGKSDKGSLGPAASSTGREQPRRHRSRRNRSRRVDDDDDDVLPAPLPASPKAPPQVWPPPAVKRCDYSLL